MHVVAVGLKMDIFWGLVVHRGGGGDKGRRGGKGKVKRTQKNDGLLSERIFYETSFLCVLGHGITMIFLSAFFSVHLCRHV